METTEQCITESPLDRLGMVVHICNPIAAQKEDAMSLKPALANSKTLSPKVNLNKTTYKQKRKSIEWICQLLFNPQIVGFHS